MSTNIRSLFDYRKNGGIESTYELVSSNFSNIIEILCRVLGLRDSYTAGHEKRVAILSVKIAEEMGLDLHTIQGLFLGARIHDIGKLSVPAEILVKPSTLSPAEFDLIKNHPVVGYEIISDIDFPWPISYMILQHHERMDGSGYPQGITGNDIIIEARIIAVADTIEAISSHRPYRAGLGVPTALVEIMSERNKYDSDIVDIAVNLLRNKEFIDFEV